MCVKRRGAIRAEDQSAGSRYAYKVGLARDQRSLPGVCLGRDRGLGTLGLYLGYNYYHCTTIGKI